MPRDKVFAILIFSISVVGIILSFVDLESTTTNTPVDTEATNSLNIIHKKSGNKILSLYLNGMIIESPSHSIWGESGTDANFLLKQLLLAEKNKSIKGILIRINSPGGTVSMSQEVYNSLMRLRKQEKIVVSSMGDVAASGGYYIASASDLIYANPGTLTGSIGVISQNLNFSRLLNKHGITDNTVTAGKYKDLGSSTRPTKASDKRILQALINDTYHQFLKDVYNGRKSSTSSPKNKIFTQAYINQKAEGLIYTGNQAVKAGLVDYIGDQQAAEKKLQELIKEKYKNTEDLPLTKQLSKTLSIPSIFGSDIFETSHNLKLKGSLACLLSPTLCLKYNNQQQQKVQSNLASHPILVLMPNFQN